MWQNYTNAFLGFCVVAIAVMTGSTIGLTLAWTFGIIGALTLCLGLWGGAADSPEYGQHKHA